MALDTQIHIYSVGTGVFFTNKEQRLYNKLGKVKREKRWLNDKLKELESELSLMGIESDKENKNYIYKEDYLYDTSLYDLEQCKEIDSLLSAVRQYTTYKSHKTKLATAIKDKLLETLKSYLEENKRSHGHNVRRLKEEFVSDKNVVSLFEGAVSRTIGASPGDLVDDLIIVQVYYFDVLQDILLHGFTYKGNKYRYFTSSAGQIRKKKAVFIKEETWNKYEKTFMCGLTMDKINEKGGMNVNKFLAYLALQSSATEPWEGFDIDRCIVVDDFETLVPAEVDYVDDKTYSVTRQKMDVPIPHMDGCGLIDTEVSKKNFMIRLPWCKGLVGAFPFKEFVLEKRLELNDMSIGVVKDIYGQEHDVIAEGIEVILTKSQFKLHSMYNSWMEYKEYFKKYNCQACICNMERERISNAKINYQMLQTLTDITDEELGTIAAPSIKELEDLTSSVDSMLRAFNVTPYNMNKSGFQKSLEIYPELLQDEYCKNTIREIKKSLVRQYRAGRLKIKGKYTFVLPDLYAFCEWLFLGEEIPKGLLQDNEVSCNLYRNGIKVDCLRSPHLYREHAVRPNRVDEETKKWFVTKGIYTSSHDIITKITMNDCDGDTYLVVADPTFVKVAERNMQGIKSLYYNMRKAQPVELTNQNLYNGLQAAFVGGNIGVISNEISKVWNNEIWATDDKEIQNNAIKTVKLLCMINNEVIDYAKCLYKSTPTEEADKLMKTFTHVNLPHFFMYAKNKLEEQVESNNGTTVNKLEGLIKNKRLTYKISDFGRIDYHLLMNNSDIKIDEKVIEEYINLNKEYRYKLKIDEEGNSNESYVAKVLKEKLNQFGYSDDEICDMLVKQLFSKKSNNKAILWLCYGENIYENLKRNIGNKTTVCPKCGKRFEKTSPNMIYCENCKAEKVKTRKCIDCGKVLESTRACRCNECKKVAQREKARLRKQKQRKMSRSSEV